MSAIPFIEKLGQSVLDLLFPPVCVNCGTAGHWLCQSCLSQIPPLADPVCQKCGLTTKQPPCKDCSNNPLKWVDGVRSAVPYEHPAVRTAIHQFKYNNHRILAPILADCMVTAYRRYQLDTDIIVPVPLHPARLKERGYNQSELLAEHLSYRLKLPVDTQTLYRSRATEAQAHKNLTERRQNVTAAFDCHSIHLQGHNVLLVDDVCTTGSTLDACAAALKTIDVQAVWGMTLARAC